MFARAARTGFLKSSQVHDQTVAPPQNEGKEAGIAGPWRADIKAPSHELIRKRLLKRAAFEKRTKCSRQPV